MWYVRRASPRAPLRTRGARNPKPRNRPAAACSPRRPRVGWSARTPTVTACLGFCEGIGFRCERPACSAAQLGRARRRPGSGSGARPAGARTRSAGTSCRRAATPRARSSPRAPARSPARRQRPPAPRGSNSQRRLAGPRHACAGGGMPCSREAHGRRGGVSGPRGWRCSCPTGPSRTVCCRAPAAAAHARRGRARWCRGSSVCGSWRWRWRAASEIGGCARSSPCAC